MKLTKTRLMEIIKEEVIKEVTSEKQRRYMCAMKDKEADERPDGLSKAEAEEMCHAPLKEEELEEGWFGFKEKEPPRYADYPETARSRKPIDKEQAQNIEDLMQRLADLVGTEENNPDSTPSSRRHMLKTAQNLMSQAVMKKILDEELEEGWFSRKKDPIALSTKKINKSLAQINKMDKKSKYKGWVEDELDDLETKEKEDKTDDALAALKAKMKASGQLEEEN